VSGEHCNAGRSDKDRVKMRSDDQLQVNLTTSRLRFYNCCKMEQLHGAEYFLICILIRLVRKFSSSMEPNVSLHYEISGSYGDEYQSSCHLRRCAV
jgi:hypothetical protein